MRKIEVDRYNCPRCNASLRCVSMDIIYVYGETDQCKTTFKCCGCQKEFYSMERPGPMPANTPEFTCPFCKESANYVPLRDSWADYWKCLPCKSTFEQTSISDREEIDVINMYTSLNGHLYVLRQYVHENWSRVELLPENLEDTVVIAHEFKFLMPNITPANIQEKLYTYLLFS